MIKTRHLVVVVALALAGCGGGGANHPNTAAGSRSRTTCETLLHHSFELERDAKTLMLSDHHYTERKVVADLEQQEQDTKASPTFLSECNELTDTEFTCMMQAPDWYTYQSCYSSSPVAGR